MSFVIRTYYLHDKIQTFDQITTFTPNNRYVTKTPNTLLQYGVHVAGGL